MLRHHYEEGLPKDRAISNLIGACSFDTTKERQETIAIDDALGRIAAHDTLSKITLPNLPTSHPDGIAIRFKDFENGAPDTSTWQEGKEYVFCNCGVGIAGDYDTSIAIENIEFEDGKLVINELPTRRGQNINPVGSIVREGDVLVHSHDVITPFLISRLVTGGYAMVDVIKKPVVAFIPTGNELVDAGTPVPEGKNVDSNSHMIRAKIVAWGGIPLIYPIQKDRFEDILNTLNDALSKADIVVINAGSSQGSEDHTSDALETVGTVLSHTIKSGPGAHTACAIAQNGTPIIGIPGPAVGAECTVDWFLKPLIDTYYGRNDPAPVVHARYKGAPRQGNDRGFSFITRGDLVLTEDGSYAVTPISFGDADGMNASNCFAIIPPQGVELDDDITVELRYPYRFVRKQND